MSLLDIVAAKKTIEVANTTVDLQGISIEDIATLMTRFPALKSLLSGEDIDVKSLLGFSGKIVGAIIAAGCGKLGNEQWETHAASLPIAIQIEILTAIIDATMPGGVRPLADKIAALSETFGVSTSAIEVDPNGVVRPLNSHAAPSN